MKRLLVAAALLLTVAACARKDAVETAPAGGKKEPAAPAAIAPVATEAPAGRYALDASHASLVFTIDHIGFSNYTGNFTRFGADLDFDPADPGKMAVTANIDTPRAERKNRLPTAQV
ncbi:MAG: YceI family protein, partial [Parvularculaceae bacterium]